MASKDNYKYSSLASIDDKQSEPVHFYGCVVDSSFPYKSENRYLMTCKVIDMSLYHKKRISECDWVTVVFYAKVLEDLPII